MARLPRSLFGTALPNLPDPEDIFGSPVLYQRPIDNMSTGNVTKSHGSGDSAKNEKSSTKAPGGSDASKQRDGG